MADFAIKRNDVLPLLKIILKDINDNPVDLTTATGVKFHMREENTGTLKIEDVAGGIDSNPQTGRVSYSWRATEQNKDTDTSGFFLGEFEVTWTGGAVQTFPGQGYISIEIVDDLS